ncbi:helix-turn-helix domain-containing protein [Xanthomonas theicola]|nr:LysR family transcriptional regulator [Xanthomonas theicola]
MSFGSEVGPRCWRPCDQGEAALPALMTGPNAHRLIGMPNNDDLPRLDDLSVFLVVLDAGGFRAASKRLGLSPSTVSNRAPSWKRSWARRC